MQPTDPTQMPQQPELVSDEGGVPTVAANAGEAQPVQYVTPVVPAQPTTPAQPMASALPPLPPRVIATPPVAPGTPVQFVTPVDAAPASAVRVFNVRRILYTALSILEVFLAIRLLLRLLAANPDAVFSRLIYALTFPFIAPFSDVFPDSQARGSVLELSTILAMIMYPLFCWIIVRVIRLTNNRRATPTPTA